MHKHKASKTETRGYVYCVVPALCGPHPEREAAHGGVIDIETCKCGAIRRSETNGRARNRGQWEEPKEAL